MFFPSQDIVPHTEVLDWLMTPVVPSLAIDGPTAPMHPHFSEGCTFPFLDPSSEGVQAGRMSLPPLPDHAPRLNDSPFTGELPATAGPLLQHLQRQQMQSHSCPNMTTICLKDRGDWGPTQGLTSSGAIASMASSRNIGQPYLTHPMESRGVSLTLPTPCTNHNLGSGGHNGISQQRYGPGSISHAGPLSMSGGMACSGGGVAGVLPATPHAYGAAPGCGPAGYGLASFHHIASNNQYLPKENSMVMGLPVDCSHMSDYMPSTPRTSYRSVHDVHVALGNLNSEWGYFEAPASTPPLRMPRSDSVMVTPAATYHNLHTYGAVMQPM